MGVDREHLPSCDVTASRGTDGRPPAQQRNSERVKLPRALFGYTKYLMSSFLTSPGGEAGSKIDQVCVVSENKVHGRGQSAALSSQLLKVGFH